MISSEKMRVILTTLALSLTGGCGIEGKQGGSNSLASLAQAPATETGKLFQSQGGVGF